MPNWCLNRVVVSNKDPRVIKRIVRTWYGGGDLLAEFGYQETTTWKMIGSRQHRPKVRIERRRFRPFERSFSKNIRPRIGCVGA